MNRVILHVDANCFYASVECLYHPSIRTKPVAVCGDPEARHGIVLTANYPAKRMGVRVGQAIWQAKQTCAGLVTVPPHYDLYVHFSRMMRAIWEEYSDRVEAFGLDENWLDVSDEVKSIRQGKLLADKLRERVKNELGITVSVGVADNKIFAKLGSDFKKPDGTTAIFPETFQETIWPLPAGDLLYVGPATAKKLARLNICTIGDLARADDGLLKTTLGKNGLLLQAFALGLDLSPVMPIAAAAAIKSIGNSTTTPHDIQTAEDAKCVYYLLAESVGARLREHGFRARCVSISARTTALYTSGCQTMLDAPTDITSEIAETAYRLFMERFTADLPLRSVGISCSHLTPASAPMQLSFVEDPAVRIRKERLDQAIDDLRRRYGHNVVQRGVVLMDSSFAALKPKEDHTIHPVPFFAG
ncbi:MAG: DNA polymerase IV [Clostridia bacterium]|nr:DNA polymerase IV [Clostridia bacterium]